MASIASALTTSSLAATTTTNNASTSKNLNAPLGTGNESSIAKANAQNDTQLMKSLEAAQEEVIQKRNAFEIARKTAYQTLLKMLEILGISRNENKLNELTSKQLVQELVDIADKNLIIRSEQYQKASNNIALRANESTKETPITENNSLGQINTQEDLNEAAKKTSHLIKAQRQAEENLKAAKKALVQANVDKSIAQKILNNVITAERDYDIAASALAHVVQAKSKLELKIKNTQSMTFLERGQSGEKGDHCGSDQNKAL